MKHILIVGGSSGIGKELNSQLVKDGYTTTCISRSLNNFDITLDEPLFPNIGEDLNGIVYCPGSILLKPFKNLKVADYRNDLEINYIGAIKTIRHFLPQLADGASIVLFSSVAVSKGMSFHTSVSGAKGAIEGFTRSLAAELAPKVRVNCIAPSLTDTPMAEKLLRNDKLRINAAERHPLKSIGAPADIAAMANFLLSDKAKWISGQILSVDGGISTLA